MRLGVGSYTFTWAIGVPGHVPPQRLTALSLLERAVALGVGVVQFCDNLPLPGLPAQELDDVCQFAKDHKIDLELGTRGILDTSNLVAHLRLARRVGANFVRVVVDGQGHEPTPEETVERLRPLLPQFADAGVKLAIENHDRFSCRVLADIIERLGPERAGICLDTVNSFGALEGPEAVVRTLAPYTLNLHVKDFRISRVSSQMGFVVSGCAAGQGRLDVPWLLQQLGGVDAPINAIIELWTPYEPDLPGTLARESAWAAESVRYLRQFLAN